MKTTYVYKNILSLACTKFKITDKEEAFFFALKTTDNNLAIPIIFQIINIIFVSQRRIFSVSSFLSYIF